VQPLFLVATEKAACRAAEGHRCLRNNVVMEETLDAAIQRLFTGSLPSMRLMETGGVTGKRPSRELSSQALEQLRKAKEALRKEDWPATGNTKKSWKKHSGNWRSRFGMNRYPEEYDLEEKDLLSWSSGKDSAWSLLRLQQDRRSTCAYISRNERAA